MEINANAFNFDFYSQLLTSQVGSEEFGPTLVSILQDIPEAGHSQLINLSFRILDDNCQWITDYACQTLSTLLSSLSNSPFPIKAQLAAKYLTLSSVEFITKTHFCHLIDRSWTQKTLRIGKDDYEKHIDSGQITISYEHFFLGFFARTHTVLGEYQHPTSTFLGLFVCEDEAKTELPMLYFVVILDKFVFYDETLLLQALSLSTNVSELVLPREIEDPQSLFNASSHLFSIQTPRRCYSRESHKPEGVITASTHLPSDRTSMPQRFSNKKND